MTSETQDHQRRTLGRHFKKRSLIVLLMTTLIAGCSQMDSNDVKTRDSEKVKDETTRVSSQILDMINLKGHVTKPGPGIIPCSDYSSDEKVYRARHPWSVYDVPIGEMRKAFDQLRTELPKKHWKIVKDGHDSSPAKTPQIVADHKEKDFSVDIRLDDESKLKPEDREGPSLIEVTVVSGCFRKA